MPKPKVSIDEDGDGDTDVQVEIDTPPGEARWPAGVRERINLLVGRMEVHISPPTVRATYASVREELRDILAHNP